jgi:hypothetical protein
MFEVVTIKTDGLGVTSEDVNRLKLSLDRQRSLTNDGMSIARLSCYTDDPTGLDEGIRVIPLMKDPEIIHDEWYQVLLWDGDMKGLREESKCTYVNARVVARQMCTSVIYEGLPSKGTTDECNFTFTDEETAAIKENNTSFFFQERNWMEDGDTQYFPHFCGWVQGDGKYIIDNFLADKAGIQEKYGTNVQQYIEDQIAENKGMVLNTNHGIVGQYIIGDEFANLEMNQKWETNVRPSFENEGEWRGLGGDQQAQFITFEHEYRDISQQCSFLHLKGEGKDPKSDRYLQLWVL